MSRLLAYLNSFWTQGTFPAFVPNVPVWLKDIHAEGNWMDLKSNARLFEMLRKDFFFPQRKQIVSRSDPQLLQSDRPPVTSAKDWT